MKMMMLMMILKRMSLRMVSDPFPMTAQRGRNSLSERNQTVLYILYIPLFECVVGKCLFVFYLFSFSPTVYVGTLNFIASIPDPSILTLSFM